MKLNAIVAGVGMTPFGKHMDTGFKALGAGAVKQAVADSGLGMDDLQAAYVGNAAAGLVTGQECIRGQVILRSIGLGKLPVVNVENRKTPRRERGECLCQRIDSPAPGRCHGDGGAL
jgi:acetyl-CoA acetyltransferase